MTRGFGYPRKYDSEYAAKHDPAWHCSPVRVHCNPFAPTRAWLARNSRGFNPKWPVAYQFEVSPDSGLRHHGPAKSTSHACWRKRSLALLFLSLTRMGLYKVEPFENLAGWSHVEGAIIE